MHARTALRGTLAFIAALLLSSAAQAQLFRAYLAINGNDANPCTLPQPCRLLPAALNAVADGGEVWLLDSANYNTATVNIGKSVTILAVPGSVGSVVATGGPAIDIATTGVRVTLRNLVLVPLPGAGATNGISMTAGDRLAIEDTLISNMPLVGVAVHAPAVVRVVGSTIRDNGQTGVYLGSGGRAAIARSTISGHSLYGFIAEGTSASTTRADIADSHFEGNNAAVVALSSVVDAAVNVAVRNSQFVGGVFGGGSQSVAGSGANFALADSLVSNNTTGIASFGAGATVWVSGNKVTANGTGFFASGGTFESAGNNALRNNGTNKSGTITTVALE